MKLLVRVFIGLGSGFLGLHFGHSLGFRYDLRLPQGPTLFNSYGMRFGFIGGAVGLFLGFVVVPLIASRMKPLQPPVTDESQPNPPPIAHS